MVAMSTPLQLRQQVARELGDSRYRVFSRDRIDDMILRGYYEFLRATRLLFDLHIQEDNIFAANCDFEFEKEFAEVVEGQSNYNFMFERQFLLSGDAGDPAAINFPEESPYAPDAMPPALMPLPSTHYQTERMTWDGKKLENFSSMAMGEGGLDFQYEDIYGEVYAYIADKDGQGRIRRYRIPAAEGYHFTYNGRRGAFRGFAPSGILTSGPRLGFFARHIDATHLYPPDVFISLSWTFAFSLGSVTVGRGLITSGIFTGMAVSGERGIIRRVPGFHPTPRQRGIPRRISFDNRNTRVEFQRRGLNPLIEGEFEVPRYCLRFVKSWALGELRAIEGPFQSMKMAAHYRGIFAAGAERMKLRKAMANSRRLTVAGAGNEARPNTRPPLARPPSNFPDTFRRRARRF